MNSPEPKIRCPWSEHDPLEMVYHDTEWGVPVHEDRKHFEFTVLDGAQAGLSWRTILYRRDNYAKAFAGFDPAKVARFGQAKIAKLLQDPGIIRNRLKINSAVKNAAAFLEIAEEFGTFDAYIWRFTDGRTIKNAWQSDKEIPAHTPQAQAMSKDFKKRGFSFAGPTICYAYMQAAGMVNDHLVSCFRYEEV